VEQRALLAFVLSLAILLGWQYFLAPKPPVPPSGGAEPAAEPAKPAAAKPAAVEQPPAPPAAPPKLPSASAGEAPVEPAEAFSSPEKVTSVETDLATAQFTSYGGRLKSFELADYRVAADPSSPHLDLVVSESLLPLGLYWTRDDGTVADDRGVLYDVRTTSQRVHGDATATVTLTGTGSSGEHIVKTVTLRGDSYVLEYSVEIGGPDNPSIGVAWARDVVAAKGRFAGTEGPAAFIDGKLVEKAAARLKEPIHEQGDIAWAGHAEHYFLAAYYPDEPRKLRFVAATGAGVGEATLWADATAGRVSYHLFVGPKAIHLLEHLDHHLEAAVNLGWFSFVARPLLELLLLLERVTGNYGWSIILLTICIRIVFYPVNKRQALAMKAMQRIQPELKKIQEKYKDDREQLNKEMMEVYRRHKVNPLSGCLPMLLQLPVFLGLYNALMQAIELRHEPFIGWITDLSQPDRLGSFSLPFVSPPGIPVMTLLMGASMLIQQRMTPSAGDPTQQRMMMFMPLVFTIMFVNFPAGLVLYWLANNLMSIGQQYLTNRS
jgi:YidC/Oxa1 family membrane protein insertase